jgi:hypothetical protein
MTEAPSTIEGPPAGIVTGSWHDAWAEIAEGALEQLRLDDDDTDRERIIGKVGTACPAIDAHLELRAVAGRVQYTIGGVTVVAYAAGDVPQQVLEAAVALSVELYRRKDASFGVLNAWSQSGEAFRIGADHLRGVASLLEPFREGWGIG